MRTPGRASLRCSRLLGVGSGTFASLADSLLADLRRDDPDALRRLRACVPRHAEATSAATAELRDARLVIAREHGFPTWREFAAFADRSRRDLDERHERRRRLHPYAEALRDGEAERLAGLTAEQAEDLLGMLAGPETIPGIRLGEELGVPRAGVEVLLAKATSLDDPLLWAARANRVEYVRLLLEAGADPASTKWGSTPLEAAIHHDSTGCVDLLAERGIVPGALWTYAACGRLDLVQSCFDSDGRLRPDAASSRPDPADAGLGLPPLLPRTGEPEEILAEAFVHACQAGRVEVVRWFLDYGVAPDSAPYYGRTGLHWAVMSGHFAVVRLLLERGADPSLRDDLFQTDVDGWLHIFHAGTLHEPETEQIHRLLHD
ncbi:ankyrin repeat domain-containing protein [Nonomuraea sp. NPDC050556]|uniref:ankyrin repeat domain-containing protein n=1 Tax=Nonomuraea sp. NPDC050556 TaxID=3364369 RepID=UPI0037B099C1